MADAFSKVAYDEIVRINSGTFAPLTGTITLTACTVTLRDATGAVAGGVNGAAATGFIATASAAPYAWYDLDPTGLALTEPTFATGQAVFTLAFRATDSGGKKYDSVQCLVVKPKGA